MKKYLLITKIILLSLLATLSLSACNVLWFKSFGFTLDKVTATVSFRNADSTQEFFEKYMYGEEISSSQLPGASDSRVKAMTPSGFTFTGWELSPLSDGNYDYDVNPDGTFSFTAHDSTANIIFVGLWEEPPVIENADLTVKFYFAPISATTPDKSQYVYNSDYDYTFEMKVGTVINTMDPGEIEGFTYLDFEASGPIAADGSTEVKVYYSRNSYSFTIADDITSYSYETSIQYEDAIKLPSDLPERDGYEIDYYALDGAKYTIPAKMPANNISLVIVWKEKPVETVTYKYEIYEENTQGYEILKSQSDPLSGVPGTVPDFTEILVEKTGFDTPAAPDETDVILADGTKVYKFVYKRKKFTVTFNLNGGNVNGVTDDLKNENARYEVLIKDLYSADDTTEFSSIINGIEPVKNGKIFAGWATSADASVGISIDTIKNSSVTDNMTYYAVWTDEPTSGVTVTVTQIANNNIDKDSDIPVTYNYNEATATLTLSITGTYSHIYWIKNGESYVDGDILVSIQLNFGAAPSSVGIYEFTVVVKTVDGLYKSGTIRFNVELSGVTKE